VAAHGNKDGRIGTLDLLGMAQGRGYIQNVQTGDARQFRAKRPDDLGHAPAFKAHIDNADLMAMRGQSRGDVFQAQRLSAKKRSETKMSGQMTRLDEQNSQSEFSLFSQAECSQGDTKGLLSS
jgi:hypothetical protein